MGPRLKYTVYLKMAELGSRSSKKAAGIMENPELLISALQAIFGRGSKTIEMKIVNEIKQLIGKADSSALDLVSLIRTVKVEVRSRPTLVSVITDLHPY